MKYWFFLFFILYIQPILGQGKPTPKVDSAPQVEIEKEHEIPKEDFERPFNFFASAGAAIRFGNLYDVAISPVDYTVQFEDVFPIQTRFSMGLVWNPFPDNSDENKKEYFGKILKFNEG